jgi:hypothetical protein
MEVAASADEPASTTKSTAVKKLRTHCLNIKDLPFGVGGYRLPSGLDATHALAEEPRTRMYVRSRCRFNRTTPLENHRTTKPYAPKGRRLVAVSSLRYLG